MGIDNGFFGKTASIGRPVTLRYLPAIGGRRVTALDISGWLHKVARAIDPVAASVHGDYSAAVAEIEKRLYLLYGQGLEVWAVFDGAEHAAKQRADTKRREKRERAQTELDALMVRQRGGELGLDALIYSAASRAIRRTDAYNTLLKSALDKNGFGFEVAPFEADSQLAYLALTGKVA